MKLSNKVHYDLSSLNSSTKLIWITLLLISLMGCKGKTSPQDSTKSKAKAKQTSQNSSVKDDQSDESVCSKVGARCTLRPGVLGVCTPSAPNTALGWTPPLLVCTPQH